MDVDRVFPTSSTASERSWTPSEASSHTLDTCTLRSSSEAPSLSNHTSDADAFPEYVLDIAKDILVDPLSPTSPNQLILLWELVLLHLFPVEEGYSVVHGNAIPRLVHYLQVYNRPTSTRESRQPHDIVTLAVVRESQSSSSPLAVVLISPSATTHLPASIHYHSGDILLNPPSVSSGLAKRAAYIAGSLARSSPYNKMLTITVHGPSQPEDAVLTGSYQHYYYPFHSGSNFLPNSLRGESCLNGVFPCSPPPSPTLPQVQATLWFCHGHHPRGGFLANTNRLYSERSLQWSSLFEVLGMGKSNSARDDLVDLVTRLTRSGEEIEYLHWESY